MGSFLSTTDEHLLAEISHQDLSPEVAEMYHRFASVLVAVDVLRESASPESLTEAIGALESERSDAIDDGDVDAVGRLDSAIRYVKNECCEPVRG